MLARLINQHYHKAFEADNEDLLQSLRSYKYAMCVSVSCN